MYVLMDNPSLNPLNWSLFFFHEMKGICFHFPSFNIPVIPFTHPPGIPFSQRKLVLAAAAFPRTLSPKFLDTFLLLVQTKKDASHYGSICTVWVLCEMSKYEQEYLVHTYWVHWQCIVAIGWSSLLLRITCGVAAFSHNCSLLASFHSRLSKIWVQRGLSQLNQCDHANRFSWKFVEELLLYSH